MKRILFIISLLLVKQFYLCSQNVLFTQFYNTPVFWNPASAGNFEGDIRATLVYKNQWLPLGKPYNTYAFSLDGCFMVNNSVTYKKNFLSYSATLLNDMAGDVNLSNLQGLLGIAYNLTVAENELSMHNIALGLNAGLNYYTFQPQKGRWGSQWNPTYQIWDPTIPVEEYFFTEKKANLALGFGFNYTFSKDKFNPNSRFRFETGLSVEYLNAPKFTFFAKDSAKIRVIPRMIYHAQASIAVKKDEYYLCPEFFTAFQFNQYDVHLGIMNRYYFRSTGFNRDVISTYDLILNLGIYYRILNSGVLVAGLEYADQVFGSIAANFSYDITFSSLSVLNKFNGGPEITLTYKAPIPSLHKHKYKKRRGDLNFQRIR